MNEKRGDGGTPRVEKSRYGGLPKVEEPGYTGPNRSDRETGTAEEVVRQQDGSPKMSRRAMLSALGMAGVALAVGGGLLPGEADAKPKSAPAIASLPSDYYNVTDYGAVGDGVADDQPAIQAAIDAAFTAGGGVIWFPKGEFAIASTVTVKPGLVMRGLGSSLVGPISKISKAFNGDMISLGSGASMFDLFVNGKGHLFSGRGVVVPGGREQFICRCDIVNMDSYCVEYAIALAGVSSTITDCIMYTNSPQTIPAVKYPNAETNGDRRLVNIDCSGGLLADFAGCSTVLVSQCNTIGVIFTDQSKKVSLVNNRIAGGTASVNVDVRGTNHVMTGNIVATPIYVRVGTNGSVIINNVTVGGTFDESNDPSNIVQGNNSAVIASNYGRLGGPASTLAFGAGDGADAASLAFGDGTGYRLTMGRNQAGAYKEVFSFYDLGIMQFHNIPTSGVGLSSGMVWRDGTTLKIVP